MIKLAEKFLGGFFFWLGRAFWLVRIIFKKTILIWNYRIYRLLGQKLTDYNEEKEITSVRGADKKNFLTLINQKHLFHLAIIMLAVLVATNSLQAQSKLDTEGGPTDSIILNLISGEEEEDIIIEEGVPDNLNTPATYLPNETAVSALPQIKPTTKAEQEAETTRDLATSEGSAAIMGPVISTTKETPRRRTSTIEYRVLEGETITGIAKKMGVSTDTILWENGLSKYSLIRPGQTLQILPVTGLTHKIARGENLGAIAKKYQASAEEIIKENKLASADDIKGGQTLIVPNGIKPAPAPVRYTSPSSQTLLSRFFTTPPEGGVIDDRAGEGHRFPWGQCTWYVAQKRYVPWRGNAKEWIANARALGYKIGSEPVIGAIIVTKESWWGHVGYVEKVTDDGVTFSEMNHHGLGVLSYRTFRKAEKKIVGYIY